MNAVIETSKKRKLIRRIVENSIAYDAIDLTEMTVEELLMLHDKFLIKLIIKKKFQNRYKNAQQFWN